MTAQGGADAAEQAEAPQRGAEAARQAAEQPAERPPKEPKEPTEMLGELPEELQPWSPKLAAAKPKLAEQPEFAAAYKSPLDPTRQIVDRIEEYTIEGKSEAEIAELVGFPMGWRPRSVLCPSSCVPSGPRPCSGRPKVSKRGFETRVCRCAR